jgi:hypothetical protein
MTSLRHLGLAGLAGLAALAFLTIAEVSDLSQQASSSAPAVASRDGSNPSMDGPSPSSAFVVQEPARLGPPLPGIAATAASSPSSAFCASRLTPSSERLSVLVNARIHEKYRSFQESLRTP